MFIPLYDSNRLRFIRRQWVVWTIIILNVGIMAAIWSLSDIGASEYTSLTLGYIPAVVNDVVELAPSFVIVPEEATFLTYSFLHAGWVHLGSNMLFLWVFGDNVEDAVGHWRFVLFYMLCAAAGAAAHGLLMPNSQQPLIGASGAVAGITAAYLILHPKVRVWVLVLGRIPLPLPAWIPLGFWVGMQIVMIVYDPFGPISWAAHVGGIVAGVVLILLLKRSDVPLFDKRIKTPEAVVLERPEPVMRPAPPRWGRGA